jgi:hypothetical protein
LSSLNHFTVPVGIDSSIDQNWTAPAGYANRSAAVGDATMPRA